jgi:hypothetical protein
MSKQSQVIDDREALKSLDNKLRFVRDRVRSVVGGYATGMYLYGAGGLGKSFNVSQELEQLGAPVRMFNSRMTGKGLFNSLGAHPDAIHLLEDMERIVDDRDAQGVLRSALWSQPGKQRIVTWTTAADQQRIEFRGGVIMVANVPLKSLPELRALATRIILHKLDVSDDELQAEMRRIAGQGWSRGRHRLDTDTCLLVCEFLIGQCLASQCPIDLRLLDNACLDYCQWDNDQSILHWRDLVAHRVQQTVTQVREEISTLSREQKAQRYRQIVRDILASTQDAQEQVNLWRERTGKSQSRFYAYKAQVENREFDSEIV